MQRPWRQQGCERAWSWLERGEVGAHARGQAQAPLGYPQAPAQTAELKGWPSASEGEAGKPMLQRVARRRKAKTRASTTAHLADEAREVRLGRQDAEGVARRASVHSDLRGGRLVCSLQHQVADQSLDSRSRLAQAASTHLCAGGEQEQDRQRRGVDRQALEACHRAGREALHQEGAAAS